MDRGFAACDDPAISMLTALIFALLPPLTAGQIADLRRGRVVVEATIDGSAGSAHAYALSRCPREAIWAVLLDHEQFPEFMPHVESVQVLQRTATSERARQAVNAVVSTVRYALDYRFDKEAYRIDYALVPELPHDIAAARGWWKLSRAPGGTLIEYQTTVDAGRPVPDFIKSYLSGRAATDALDAIRKRAEARCR
jgi:ribosome-associated toxin RatA of RatAB toxin-antitoxin module